MNNINKTTKFINTILNTKTIGRVTQNKYSVIYYTTVKTPQPIDPHAEPHQKPKERNELDPKPGEQPRDPNPSPFPGEIKPKPSDFPRPDELYPQPI